MKFLEAAPTAVVIPVHGGLPLTVRCLESLRKCDPLPIMVVIVDDGSPDGTAAHLATHHPDVHVLPASGDLWWGASINLGCEYAIQRGAKTLILLNNDNVALSANLLCELVRLVEDHGGVVGATTLREAPDGSRMMIGEGTLDWRGRGSVFRRAGEPYVESNRVTECEWLPGMALAFGAGLFRQLGGIDASTFPQSRGDADFTLRARALGYPCLVSSACWIVNDPGQGPIAFYHRLGVRDFFRGLVVRNSSYQIRTTLAFFLRYCPRRRLVPCLFGFYARYVYAWLKTQRLPRSEQATTAAT